MKPKQPDWHLPDGVDAEGCSTKVSAAVQASPSSGVYVTDRAAVPGQPPAEWHPIHNAPSSFVQAVPYLVLHEAHTYSWLWQYLYSVRTAPSAQIPGTQGNAQGVGSGVHYRRSVPCRPSPVQHTGGGGILGQTLHRCSSHPICPCPPSVMTETRRRQRRRKSSRFRAGVGIYG